MYQKTHKRKPHSVRKGELKSTLERNTLLRLRSLTKRRKITVDYETSVLPYTIRKHYIPDFTCIFPNGRVIFIEAKGWFRPEDRTKMLAVKEANPHLDIRMVFPSNNKLNSKSKTRYSDWCTKHGFMYCIGEIPKEWFHA